jgi:predicted AAA+ superfamily ATPase
VFSVKDFFSKAGKKTKSGREVDFIVQTPKREKLLVQVCESLAIEKTRKREIVALQEAMSELNLTSGIIVTRNEEERLVVEGNTIHIMSIWRFLIEDFF